MALSDVWLGRPLRAFPNAQNQIYLTFDDGPDPEGTPAVLNLLQRHQARATFFVVSNRAAAQPALMRRILAEGHALGNHSSDHHYSHYFAGQRSLMTWVSDAEKQLQDLSGEPTVGFRPPAGVRTPALARALTELDEPMILWSTRYYDSLWGWSQKAAQSSLASLVANNIVLLHDRQRRKKLPEFLLTLDWLLNELNQRGWTARALQRWDCLSAWRQLRD